MGSVRLASSDESNFNTAFDGEDGLAVMSPTQVKKMILDALESLPITSSLIGTGV